MKIRTELPSGVHSIAYVKNSHWIELEDDRRRKTKLLDNALMRFDCSTCDFVLFTPSNPGALACPLCRAPMSAKWHRVQVCFVPEAASDFHMPQEDDE